MISFFQTSQENIALIPTRTSKISTTKPAANPLQFVKVGPCDLSRFAQEQAKKAEEVKKVKPEKRDEAVDWQSVSSYFVFNCKSLNQPFFSSYSRLCV